MDKAGAFLNKAKRQMGLTSIGAGDDEQFLQNVLRFKDLDHKVKMIEENLKKYEKSVSSIVPALDKLALSLTEFYSEEDYLVYGKEFTNACHIVSEAVKDFQNEEAGIRHELEDYLVKVSAMKKNIQVNDDLFASMKDKEKVAQKGGKNANIATEKFNAAKESYESKHEEVARELDEINKNKYTEFEPKFLGIVEALRHLFSKISTSFEMPDLGISGKTSSGTSSARRSDRISASISPSSQPSDPPLPTKPTLSIPLVHPPGPSPMTSPHIPESSPPPESEVSTSSGRILPGRPPRSARPVSERMQPILDQPPSDQGQPIPPDRGQPILPDRGHPTLPDRGQPILPDRGQSLISDRGQPTVPERGQPTLPDRGHPMVPDRGQPPAPNRGQPPAPDRGQPPAPDRVQPPAPDRGQPPAPDRGQPPAPVRGQPPAPDRGQPPAPVRGPSVPDRVQPPQPDRGQPPAPDRGPSVPDRVQPPPQPDRGQPPAPDRRPSVPDRGQPSVPGRPSSVSFPVAAPLSSTPPPPVQRPTAPSYYTADGKLSVVPQSERVRYEELFRGYDTGTSGLLTGQIAFEMFSGSGLVNDQLAIIWELSDQDGDGNLSSEEFVLAMYLINAKLRNNISELPRVLPPEWTILPGQSSPAPVVPGQYGGPAPAVPGQYGGPAPAVPGQYGGPAPAVPRQYGGPAPAVPGQYGGPAPPVSAQLIPENYAAQAERQAQQYVGQQVGNAAMDRKNQEVIGTQIAANTSNPLVAHLATNSTVQKTMGTVTSRAANDPRVQQAATDQLKAQASAQAKKGNFF